MSNIVLSWNIISELQKPSEWYHLNRKIMFYRSRRSKPGPRWSKWSLIEDFIENYRFYLLFFLNFNSFFFGGVIPWWWRDRFASKSLSGRHCYKKYIMIKFRHVWYLFVYFFLEFIIFLFYLFFRKF